MRLDKAIDLYLDTFDKATTASTYRKALAVVVDHVGPGRDINQIDPADLVRVLNHLRERDYSPATLRQRVTSIKTFFRWLHKMELTSGNPARVLKVPRPRKPQTREKAITDDELRLLLDYVQYRSRRDFALFMFLADTGCRIGGAAGLRVDQIDWNKREAVVTEKGDQSRSVRFGTDTANAIRAFLGWRKHKGGFVFSNDGSPIAAESLSQRVRRACKGLQKQGIRIRTLSAHSFRHRKGHQFADAKINPAVAATALGHESVMTTLEFYYPDDWETAAEALEEFSLKRG